MKTFVRLTLGTLLGVLGQSLVAYIMLSGAQTARANAAAATDGGTVKLCLCGFVPCPCPEDSRNTGGFDTFDHGGGDRHGGGAGSGTRESQRTQKEFEAAFAAAHAENVKQANDFYRRKRETHASWKCWAPSKAFAQQSRVAEAVLATREQLFKSLVALGFKLNVCPQNVESYQRAERVAELDIPRFVHEVRGAPGTAALGPRNSTPKSWQEALVRAEPALQTPPGSSAHAQLLRTAQYAEHARHIVATGDGLWREERLAYVDVADHVRRTADHLYANGDLVHGDGMLAGANALLDDTFSFAAVRDKITRGSTFLAGMVHGFTGIPGQSIEGYEDSFAIGQIAGAMLGLGADTLAETQAAPLAACSDALAIGTAGVMAPAAVAVNSLTAAEVSVSWAAAQGHWERFQKAQSVLSKMQEPGGSRDGPRLGRQPHHPKTEPDPGKPAVEWGHQDKHTVGSNNWQADPERSIITHHDPQHLLNKGAGTGQPVAGTRGQPGFKERVTYEETIGLKYVGLPNNWVKTNKGLIHYSKRGAHIVPANP